ncbi:GntR family transcriptional regulator [Streptococcus penaeicida]|uniref:GntR family transcriptional regulator n=1 Tax=Streptococcus penaeicida TaxID=1765960 RepID=A0A2N8LE83_9STRE|nr:GntR family transcriptional regulator [Streptococcus penaeicida]PND48444.1 GntR family transcriptional regulator [Streptococcus penaeicida]
MKKEQPLYQKLVDQLEVTIRKDMSPHDKLLSERELSENYSVSRITVRQALKELETRGLIYKVHGKGTYVSKLKEPLTDLSLAYSFTEQMKKIGKEPRTQILSFEKVEIKDHLENLLEMESENQAFELERLRLADGQPMMFERSYLPCSIFCDLTSEILKEKPLYDIFSADYLINVRLAEEEFYASIALDFEAKLLGIKKGDPVLHMIRKTYNEKNVLVEHTFSIARADQFKYRVIHQPNKL